ncbi:hypothetical protein CEQ90_17950 [Lewinellaceae bacterium SD302]|nr:hypothetical protein CEQ90_17950 [Lewinellaceae bacterium SD302]
MISAPVPENEIQRLAALRRYQILDTLEEEEYDNLVKIAAEICNTPISLISLVDEDRQWFKAKVGMDAPQTSREVAVCAHNILLPEEPLVVPNMLEDDRFYDSPLVTDGIEMKFYAGVPLIAEGGEAIGSLCVIDRQPRELTNGQLEALKALSRQVMVLLNSRLKNFQLEEQQRKMEMAFTNLNEFANIISHDLRAPLRIIDQYIEVIEEDFPALIKGDLSSHLTTIKDSAHNARNMVQGVLQYCRSINVLQDPQDPFRVNEMLRQLIEEEIDSDKFTVLYPEEEIWLVTSKLALRQIFQNLIANAVRYHDKDKGHLEVTYKFEDGSHLFGVRDDGPGIPDNYQKSIFKLFQTAGNSGDKRDSHGIGLTIVKKLVNALGGEVWLESVVGEGSTFYFTLQQHELADLVSE